MIDPSFRVDAVNEFWVSFRNLEISQLSLIMADDLEVFDLEVFVIHESRKLAKRVQF